MSTASKIEWTETTWNPTTGCDRISPGCDNCYALTLAKRLKAMGSAKYQNDGDPRTSGPGFGVTFHEDALTEPLRWRKPRKVFVNSMSDLFHKDVPDEFLVRVFDVMITASRHTFQVLTKRHGRMRSFVTRYASGAFAKDLSQGPLAYAVRPPRNIWLGVSVEDQKRAELRIPALLDTPAAVRFLSCEPLLGAVDLTRISTHMRGPVAYWEGRDQINALTGYARDPEWRGRAGVSWVIAGGESGPGARPMHPEWARSLRDQCRLARVPFLFKQWGEWGPDGPPSQRPVSMANDGTVYQPGELSYPNGSRYGEAVRARHDRAHLTAMYRVGKKAAGRELDGRTWDEFPAVTG